MENYEKKRILIIEDEKHIAEGLKLSLSLQGYEIEIAFDGNSALQKWKQFNPDLIVLDIMLPVINGFSVLQHIRLEDEKLPVLILSARGDCEDKIKGFSLGTDDYISKPFNLDEFLLRVERLLTRTYWQKEKDNLGISNPFSLPNTYIFGTNRIEFDIFTAYCKQGKIRLTDQEVKLLKLFILNKGKPLSREQLLEIVGGYTKNMNTRTLDNFIVRLRKYFEDDPKKPVYFKSLRNVGYMFEHE